MKIWKCHSISGPYFQGFCDIFATQELMQAWIDNVKPQSPSTSVEECDYYMRFGDRDSQVYTTMHHEGFVRLGDLSDCRCTRIGTAYATVAEYDSAKKAFDAKLKASIESQDRYYSRPWV